MKGNEMTAETRKLIANHEAESSSPTEVPSFVLGNRVKRLQFDVIYKL